MAPTQGSTGFGLDAVDKLWKSACALLPPDPYWLARCEGWQVTTPNGRLGSVRRLLYGTRLDRPDALIIQTGLFKRRRLVVPTETVSEVLPSQGKLRLASEPIEMDFATVLTERARNATQARKSRPTRGVRR